MSDDQAKITVTCSREFKRKVKSTILNNGIDNVQDGYLKMLELGEEQLRKSKKKEVNKE